MNLFGKYLTIKKSSIEWQPFKNFRIYPIQCNSVHSYENVGEDHLNRCIPDLAAAFQGACSGSLISASGGL